MCDGTFDNVCSKIMICSYCGSKFEGHGDESFCSPGCDNADYQDYLDDKWDD